MKLSRFIFLSCFVILAACSKQPPVNDAGGAIAFSEPEVVATRSGLIKETSQLLSGADELAYSVFASKYIPSATGAITAHEQFMNNVKVYTGLTDGVAGSEWLYDATPEEDGLQPVFWTVGAAHKFFAAYPYYSSSDDTYDMGIKYEIDESKHSLKVTMNGSYIVAGTDEYGKNECPDILYGTVLYEEPYSLLMDRGKVCFNLNHALAAVSFKIRNASEDNITRVSEISFTGLKNKAAQLYFSESGAEWPQTGDLESDPAIKYKVPVIAGVDDWSQGKYYSPSGRDYWYTGLVIPQNFADYDITLSFKVTFYGGSKKEYSLKLSEYRVGSTAETQYAYSGGNHYIYNFDVTSSKITCTVSIVPWIEDLPIELN